MSTKRTTKKRTRRAAAPEPEEEEDPTLQEEIEAELGEDEEEEEEPEKPARPRRAKKTSRKAPAKRPAAKAPAERAPARRPKAGKSKLKIVEKGQYIDYWIKGGIEVIRAHTRTVDTFHESPMWSLYMAFTDDATAEDLIEHLEGFVEEKYEAYTATAKRPKDLAESRPYGDEIVDEQETGRVTLSLKTRAETREGDVRVLPVFDSRGKRIPEKVLAKMGEFGRGTQLAIRCSPHWYGEQDKNKVVGVTLYFDQIVVLDFVPDMGGGLTLDEEDLDEFEGGFVFDDEEAEDGPDGYDDEDDDSILDD